MSDIQIQFDWYVIPLLVLIIGWPGLLIGAAGGAVAWRQHRIIGTLLGALAGLALWAGVQYLWL